jgi:hypothetical protein
MGKAIPQSAIHPGACDCAEQHNGYHGGARADLDKQGARAGAGQAPAQSKNEPPVNLAFAEFFRCERNGLAVDGLDVESLD